MLSHRTITIRWLMAYTAVIAAVLGGALYARQRAIALYGTPQAQAEWDAWREAVAKQAEGDGPVKRRVPKSDKPPALVLATTYFGICLTIALVLTTVLFGTTMFFLRGVFGSSQTEGKPQRTPRNAEEKHRRAE